MEALKGEPPYHSTAAGAAASGEAAQAHGAHDGRGGEVARRSTCCACATSETHVSDGIHAQSRLCGFIGQHKTIAVSFSTAKLLSTRHQNINRAPVCLFRMLWQNIYIYICMYIDSERYIYILRVYYCIYRYMHACCSSLISKEVACRG